MKNPTTRIFLWVTLGYLLVTAYFTIWTYREQCQQSEQSSLFRLEGIANAVALQINGDMHHRLTTDKQIKDAILFNAQDTNYGIIHHTLRQNFEANRLNSPVYTMVFDTSKQHFEFIVTSADTPYYRHTYNTFPQLLKTSFTEGGVLPMYKDEFDTWLTAFAPIRDMHGRTVAIVMVDEHFDTFILQAKQQSVENLKWALLIIFPIIIILMFGLRRLLFREVKLKNQLQESYNVNMNITAELAKTNDKLTNLDTVRKEMIANISHDLRTPLTNLSGYLETLSIRGQAHNTIDNERFLTIARKEAQRLKKMIDDLFQLTHLENNQAVLNVEAFPIGELLYDVFTKYETLCSGKNIKITSNLTENTPWVVADLKLIDRVLQNLMDNAIRYNVPFEGKSYGEINLCVEQKEQHLIIKISNTSETIPPSVLEHLFDRYFRTVSNIEGSTGLGLAIVKKIIELHSTDIHVISENQITTFTFYLPITRP